MNPTESSARIEALDVVRGFSLWGIILINFPSLWIGLDHLTVVLRAHPGRADAWAFGLVTFLVEAKFYPVFAFLFGYGFALQAERLGWGTPLMRTVLARRYGFLLALGIVHGVFLFFGDILTVYAVCGFVLLLNARPDATWRRRALTGFGLCYGLLTGVAVLVPATDADMTQALLRLQATTAGFALSGPLHGWAERASFYGQLQLLNLFLFVPQILFFMTLGISAQHWGLFGTDGPFGAPGSRPRPAPTSWWLALGAVVALGIIANGVYAAVGVAEGLGRPVAPAASVAAGFAVWWGWLMSPVMVLGLAALCRHNAARSVCRALAALGRLALSAYLLQSLAMLLLAALMSRCGTTPRYFDLTLAGLGVAALETVAAPVYLRYFAQGPMEALWRRFSYAPVRS